MNTYTINSISPSGIVNVTFSVDGKAQNISNLPVIDPVALVAALNKYAVTYAADLAAQITTVPSTVTALVGTTQTVTTA